MKKIQVYLFLFLGLNFSSQAQMFEFSSKDATKIQNRKLIVVLAEEDESLLNRIKKDAAKTSRYKAMIAYNNGLLKKTITAFWNTGQAVEYKTAKECIALSDSSQAYYTLEFSSLRLNENTQLYYLKPDTGNIYPIRTTLMQRKEYGAFDLKLIEKFKGSAFYTFVTPSSAPNEYDFITAVQFMSAMVKGKLADPKFNTRNYELKIQHDNEKLVRRTLLADSNIVNKKSKSFAYIKEEYDSLALYELSDPKGISAKAYSKDTTYAYLNVVPYIDPLAHNQSPWVLLVETSTIRKRLFIICNLFSMQRRVSFCITISRKKN